MHPLHEDGSGGLARGYEAYAVMNRSIRTFTVLPHLPERLQALHKLAYNMWWCWSHEAVSLFRRIDDELFED